MKEQLNDNSIISRVETNGSYYTGKKICLMRDTGVLRYFLEKINIIHCSLL